MVPASDHPRFLTEWKDLLNQRGAKADGAMDFPTAQQLEATDVLVIYAPDGMKSSANSALISKIPSTRRWPRGGSRRRGQRRPARLGQEGAGRIVAMGRRKRPSGTKATSVFTSST
jgi:hypothetical protein